MLDSEVVARIAQKIRMIRLEKNMTIQQLATRSKVSKGLLSKIENSRTIPSLPVFINIKKDQTVPMSRENRNGFHYNYLLSQNISTGTMEAVLLNIEPDATGTPTTSDGYELKYVLSGSCQYQINNETITLEEGDTLYFDASIPHLPINHSRKKVAMLVIYFMFPKS